MAKWEKLSLAEWGERMILSLAVVVGAVALISASAIVVDYTQQSVGTALMRGRFSATKDFAILRMPEVATPFPHRILARDLLCVV